MDGITLVTIRDISGCHWSSCATKIALISIFKTFFGKYYSTVVSSRVAIGGTDYTAITPSIFVFTRAAHTRDRQTYRQAE